MSFASIVILSVAEVYGDFNLRWYVQTNKPAFLANGLLGYIGVIYFLIESLRSGNVLYVNGMWDGISAVIESIAAYILLGDRLDKWSQYLGLVLAVVGIFLLKNGV